MIVVMLTMISIINKIATDNFQLPEPADIFKNFTQKNSNYDVILRPDKDEPEWWAGAPSVVRDSNGIFWLACRMRTAEGQRGLRGYEIRILKSEDGIHFKTVKNILREQVPVSGFERPAIVIDKKTSKYKLYACSPDEHGVWSIIKFDDADTPEEFKPDTAKKVIQPPEKRFERDIQPRGYKDPFIFIHDNLYHCYVIGYIRENEWIFHFTSEDGETWKPIGNSIEPIMNLNGWHNFFVRPSSILPLGVGFVFVYEGSNMNWYDPVYNIATGLGFTFDLHNIIDLTPNSPFLVSLTPGDKFATFRYSHWLWVNDEVWIYAEVVCPNRTHEIRLYRVKR
ncbi:MAG TPA: hypothetical protein PLT82_00660 [Candidatus Hydrogenedens sp.]|nr:hypothetical protein [Candidatus Hydrogenedens sp.]HOK08332.1 hypothetical protein [Candidatus Hydrogenedens sp.]HPP57626.1 hypothetical protein [Candidatus Hydrogenedens sp.]